MYAHICKNVIAGNVELSIIAWHAIMKKSLSLLSEKRNAAIYLQLLLNFAMLPASMRRKLRSIPKLFQFYLPWYSNHYHHRHHKFCFWISFRYGLIRLVIALTSHGSPSPSSLQKSLQHVISTLPLRIIRFQNDHDAGDARQYMCGLGKNIIATGKGRKH